jgi:hypothetical protein
MPGSHSTSRARSCTATGDSESNASPSSNRSRRFDEGIVTNPPIMCASSGVAKLRRDKLGGAAAAGRPASFVCPVSRHASAAGRAMRR